MMTRAKTRTTTAASLQKAHFFQTNHILEKDWDAPTVGRPRRFDHYPVEDWAEPG
jgi:hypothetical protein